MSLDLSSLNGSISSFFNRHFTSTNNNNESDDIKTQIRDYAKNIISNRKNLSDYISSSQDSFENLSDTNVNSSLLSAVSKMKNTSSMSAIEKYKYMMEQANNSDRIDTTEPDAEKLLSKSEQIIQKALTQGISVSDTVNLSKALTAKQVALSRLDMLG